MSQVQTESPLCQLNNYKPKQLELQGFSMLPNQFTFTEWVHSSSLSLNTVTTEITIIRLVGAVYGKKKKQKAQSTDCLLLLTKTRFLTLF